MFANQSLSAAEGARAEDSSRSSAVPSTRILVATANRTHGAVVCGLVGKAGHAANWISLRELGAAAGVDPCDLLLLEAVSCESLASVASLWTGSKPSMIAILKDGRPELRSACEAAGFAGCLASPVDPMALQELVEAVTARTEGVERSDQDSTAPGADSEKGVIDRRALEDLAGLGGRDFVHEIVSQFFSDADMLLQSLKDAAVSGDVEAFRDQAHALRSCAANVGASGVYSNCLALRDIETEELAEEGENHVIAIGAHVERAREFLQGYLAHQ